MSVDSIPVEVRLTGDSPILARRIEEVAERLNAEIVGGGGARTPRIGDVELPPDPPDWFLEAAVLRALRPRHLLFLCVANSARSQMGEGLARALATEEGAWSPDAPLKISSAGSEPSTVRPQAVAVLGELGIDISTHRSTGADEVEGPVDAVITLCAEEVCPVWLEDAWRLHWGLPDPAAVQGSEEEKLAAFRRVRDELRRRLGFLLLGRDVARPHG